MTRIIIPTEDPVEPYFIDMIYLIGAKLDFKATLTPHTK